MMLHGIFLSCFPRNYFKSEAFVILFIAQLIEKTLKGAISNLIFSQKAIKRCSHMRFFDQQFFCGMTRWHFVMINLLMFHANSVHRQCIKKRYAEQYNNVPIVPRKVSIKAKCCIREKTTDKFLHLTTKLNYTKKKKKNYHCHSFFGQKTKVVSE